MVRVMVKEWYSAAFLQSDGLGKQWLTSVEVEMEEHADICIAGQRLRNSGLI